MEGEGGKGANRAPFTPIGVLRPKGFALKVLSKPLESDDNLG